MDTQVQQLLKSIQYLKFCFADKDSEYKPEKLMEVYEETLSNLSSYANDVDSDYLREKLDRMPEFTYDELHAHTKRKDFLFNSNAISLILGQLFWLLFDGVSKNGKLIRSASSKGERMIVLLDKVRIILEHPGLDELRSAK